jgi:DNA-binding response OmpR family regulator
MSKRILIVEDDSALARVLTDNLRFEGMEVVCVGTGAEAMTETKARVPDLVILDLTLPDTNGFELCTRLRQSGTPPIIMLTARVQKADKLRGLNLGADDYITKPFDLEEVLARVRAVLRRARPVIERLTLGDVAVDFVSRSATKGGRALHLTHRELDLLHFLAERQHRFVSRDELLQAVWGYPLVPMTRSVDHAVGRLRKKIEANPHQPEFIHTVHGDGYRLTPRPAAVQPAPIGGAATN